MTVSVVMATFNGERFLQEQLDSIRRGTVVPDEFVVVDDTSGDDTVHLLEMLRSELPDRRITILRNTTNVGPTRSFVRGIAASTGDVIFLADQDDTWVSTKIERLLVPFIDPAPVLMAYSDGAITNTDLEPDGRTLFNSRSKARLADGANREPQELVVNPDVKGCSMALQGDFARGLFEQSDPTFADYWGHDHWAALFAFGLGRVAVVPEILLLHRLHGGNASAAMRFNPFKSGQLKRYLRMAGDQQKDHFVQRYRIAITTAEGYGNAFSPTLLEALREVHAIADRRYRITLRPRPLRVSGALRLWHQGIYTRHFNGVWTLLRDILL